MPDLNKNLNINHDFPPGLHEKIMASIVWLRWRNTLSIVLVVMCCNFIFFTFHAGLKAIDTEAWTAVKILIDNFELNFDYFAYSLNSLLAILPMAEIYLMTFNLFGIIATVTILEKLHHRLNNFKILNY